MLIGAEGIRPEAIRLILDIESIPQEERSLLTRKLTAYVGAAIRARGGIEDKEPQDV
jgi:hypothetical protein